MGRLTPPKIINKWSRRAHRWGAIAIMLPVGLVIVTGILLQLKKQWTWVQPPTIAGAQTEPTLSFDEILAIASGVAEAEIRSWDDVDRLDVRPGKGSLKVRSRNRWEVQIDASSGAVLHVAYRRSDLIESVHDGSWFHDRAKLWVFLPSGAILLMLWATGLYLWILPIWNKRAGKLKRSAAKARAG